MLQPRVLKHPHTVDNDGGRKICCRQRRANVGSIKFLTLAAQTDKELTEFLSCIKIKQIRRDFLVHNPHEPVGGKSSPPPNGFSPGKFPPKPKKKFTIVLFHQEKSPLGKSPPEKSHPKKIPPQENFPPRKISRRKIPLLGK